MLRYFATRWASIILGTGAFFVALGLVISADESLLVPITYSVRLVNVPEIPYQLIINNVMFSLFFYGGLQMAIGISVLLLQRFRRLESRDVVLMNQLD